MLTAKVTVLLALDVDTRGHCPSCSWCWYQRSLSVLLLMLKAKSVLLALDVDTRGYCPSCSWCWHQRSLSFLLLMLTPEVTVLLALDVYNKDCCPSCSWFWHQRSLSFLLLMFITKVAVLLALDVDTKGHCPIWLIARYPLPLPVPSFLNTVWNKWWQYRHYLGQMLLTLGLTDWVIIF